MKNASVYKGQVDFIKAGYTNHRITIYVIFKYVSVYTFVQVILVISLLRYLSWIRRRLSILKCKFICDIITVI